LVHQDRFGTALNLPICPIVPANGTVLVIAVSVLGFLGQSDLRSLDLIAAFQLPVIGPRIRLGVLTPIGMWKLSGVHNFV
jgi:hypothetical protein